MKNSTITAVISSGDIKQTAITRENKRPSKNTPAKLDSAGLIWQQRPACCCRKSTRVSARICWQNCEEGKVAFAWGRTSTAGSFSHAQRSINTRPLQALIKHPSTAGAYIFLFLPDFECHGCLWGSGDLCVTGAGLRFEFMPRGSSVPSRINGLPWQLSLRGAPVGMLSSSGPL